MPLSITASTEDFEASYVGSTPTGATNKNFGGSRSMVRTTDLYPVSRLINAKSGFDSQLPYHLDLGIVRFHAGGRNARYNALSHLPRVPFMIFSY